MYFNLTIFFSLSFDVAFGKFEAVKLVTPVYQETTGRNILADEY